MSYRILKIVVKSILISFCIFFGAESKTFKVKKLEIDLFSADNLLESRKVMSESFALIKINVFAERTKNNEIGSIIKVVTAKITQHGREVKVFLDNYLFKDSTSLFNNPENLNYFLTDKRRLNTLSIQEINLSKYLKTQDEAPEFKSAIKNLKKKYDINLPERVLKSDHVYLRGNGDIVWVSHMVNYENDFGKEIFDNNNSKFHPNSINQHPNYKEYMDRWINLSLSRHNEFQNKLKIKDKHDLVYEGYDNNKEISKYKNEFYEYKVSNIKSDDLEITKKAKEQKAKEAKERKAKEAKERKAKEEKERKAKEAKERKAKEEKERKAKEEITKSEDELSVDDLMSKIKELNEMYKSGIISKEEFEMLKNKLLKN